MRQAILQERPDGVLHLGDVVRDALRLQEDFPDLPMEQIRGNCDMGVSDIPEEKEIFLGGKRIWMLHGHTYWVKMGLNLLTAEAQTRGVDVVTFGHTHQPLCDRNGPLWILNPGTVQGYPGATCGVIEIKDGKLSCRTLSLR
jgi:hypothetical protein